ncbi:MAG: TetR/AcrR family transcriptional regulator [Spirochaetaceae bacterium]|nr:MAG: TetR/AcrR family transcriptional regulator [Spirochaetaceae bacterium]
MPRRFTEDEERRIKTALWESARGVMGMRGVRKTSIDELVNAAGIAKGSFYRFYPSKEALALEILAEWERGFHEGIARRFESSSPRGHAETALVLQAVFLEDFPQQVMASGLQGLMEAEEVAHLQQRSDAAHRHLMDEQDLRLFERLGPHFLAAELKPAVAEEVIIAGLRLLFDAGLRTLRGDTSGPRTLGPEHYHQAFGELLHGFLLRVFSSTVTPSPSTSQRSTE